MENKNTTSPFSGHTLEQLNDASIEYFLRHRDNGGASEFDPSINDISRAKIEAYREKHGQCFLGKVNLWDKDRNNPDYRFVPYTGQKVFNFEYDLVMPHEDETLRLLVIEHNRTHDTFSNNDIWDRIQQISARLAEIDGINLIWA